MPVVTTHSSSPLSTVYVAWDKSSLTSRPMSFPHIYQCTPCRVSPYPWFWMSYSLVAHRRNKPTVTPQRPQPLLVLDVTSILPRESLAITAHSRRRDTSTTSSGRPQADVARDQILVTRLLTGDNSLWTSRVSPALAHARTCIWCGLCRYRLRHHDADARFAGRLCASGTSSLPFSERSRASKFDRDAEKCR